MAPCILRQRRVGSLSLLVVLLVAFGLVGSGVAGSRDVPLAQKIKDAEAEKAQLAGRYAQLRKEWQDAGALIIDLSRFRDQAQAHVERGVVTLGSRLFRDATAPLIKNHGVTIVNKVLGVSMTSTETVGRSTVRWATLRNNADSSIRALQAKQAERTQAMAPLHARLLALDDDLDRWKKELARALDGRAADGKKKSADFDYDAALGKWMSDYVAECNQAGRDEPIFQDYRKEVKFKVAPHILHAGPAGAGIYGSHEIIMHWSYYDGPKKGQSGSHQSNSFFFESPDPGGMYLSLGQLRAKYPQFAKR